MRVATVVLGLVIGIAGGASEAADTRQGPSALANSRAVAMAEGVVVPRARLAEVSPTSMLHVYEHGAGGAMGFLPAEKTPLSSRAANLFGDDAGRRYHPAQIPLPATRSLEDHLLTGFVALMLIAYQLRRKHRFLRPHRFGI